MYKTLFTFLFVSVISFSQSILIYEDFVILDGDTANQYLNGEKHGLWVEYSEINERQSSCWSSQKRPSASVIQWYWEKGKYIFGIKSGIWSKYYYKFLTQKSKFDSLGQIEYSFGYYRNEINSIKTYDNGKPFRLVVFHANGKINFKARYRNNLIKDFQTYYLDGTLKFQGTANGIDFIENLKFYTEEEIPRDYRPMTMVDILNRIGLSDLAMSYMFDLLEN